MNRKAFIKALTFLGLSAISAYADAKVLNTKSDKNKYSVIIIGAGAAGIAAAYLLAKLDIDFIILEASNRYGGRLKDDTNFADFPIPLGAEWLHVDRDELNTIIADNEVEVAIDMQGYKPNSPFHHYKSGKLSKDTMGDFTDLRFANSSWLSFFEQYLLPHVRPHIRLHTEVTHVDYSGDMITVKDRQGNSYQADKLMVTVPLAMLKRGTIAFTPKLPAAKQDAIRRADVWPGMKVFIEFKEAFYPAFLEFPDSDTKTGQRAYYDAAYAHDTQHNILGLFAVGNALEHYQNDAGEFQLAWVLDELDEIYNGAASQHYIKHTVQNWTEEPFIQGAYLSDHAPRSIPKTLAQTIDQKIYFAGDAYTNEGDWGAVHNATRSAAATVKHILEHL